MSETEESEEAPSGSFISEYLERRRKEELARKLADREAPLVHCAMPKPPPGGSGS